MVPANVRVLSMISFVSTLGIALPFSYMATMIFSTSPWLAPIQVLNSEQTYGLIAGLFPLGQFISGPFAGRAADKLGYKRVLALMLLISIFGFALSGWYLYQQNTLLFAISRLITGMTEGNSGLIRAYIAISTPENLRIKAFSTQNNAMVAGWLTGPPLGSLLTGSLIFNKPIFWLPFLFATLFAIVSLVLFLNLSPISTAGAKTSSSKTDTKEKIKLTDISSWFLISFLFTLGLDGFYQFYPTLLVTKHNSNSDFIATTAIFITSGILISNRFGVPKIKKIELFIFLSGLTICTILTIISFSKNQIWILLLSPLLGASIAFITSLIPAKISNKISKRDQGFALSLLASTRSLGDSFICFSGGLALKSSAEYPIILSAIFVFAALIFFTASLKAIK